MRSEVHLAIVLGWVGWGGGHGKMVLRIWNKMGSNGREHIKIPGNVGTECPETTVEIKIKTLDSQTFTLRVDKCVPVPELKEQIASLTGVLSQQQRLICRGKVLKDDQLLSAYHVEDGHTLHLVVRQPVAPSPESLSDHAASILNTKLLISAATEPTSSSGNNPGSRGPGMVVGTFNISEQGDGAFPDLNRIVSAVLNSFGATRFGSGGEGIDLNQPPLERVTTAPGLSGARNSSRSQSDQAASVAAPVESLQPPVIPDSLTTLLQYSTHLRQEFLANAGGDGQVEAAVGSSEARGVLAPESLAEAMLSTRQLLVEQATECLSQLAGQLECHSSVTDPLERSRIQSNAIRSGSLFQNLGALLLELGRAIMTLRMGQTPADALVNAGPSVFISSTGPNPIMVQPLPFQPGANVGSVPVGTVQHGSGTAGGSVGAGFLPRNIDIRIRTGSLFPRRETTGSQPQGQVAASSPNVVNSGQQDAARPDTNSQNREPQVRAIPLRTVVAAVPASVGRTSDSSRGSIGILYPVLARVQHVSSLNSSGTRASQASGQHLNPDGNNEQSMPDSATQQPNTAIPGGNGNRSLSAEALNGQGFTAEMRGGLEQLLNTIFPMEHVLGDNTNLPGSGGSDSVPSQSEGAQGSEEAASAVSEEGIVLSNILRQIMPIISQNTPSTEEANSVETQADDNPDRAASSRHRRGPRSQPSPKRRRRE
ncbi:hypothetical protein BUALT_Bualt05G0002500 [Buddleja alternifolia]|uniref:Ubiquitin-like domain-containing protein n=1 Tax=Buddleja alternifolia TaxID=168488 RepID=A0AAV6XJM5_9LAMI|nr:hypothetical protein BUALT_Bualt05G0002500 [Buddleja alternifolia]